MTQPLIGLQPVDNPAATRTPCDRCGVHSSFLNPTSTAHCYVCDDCVASLYTCAGCRRYAETVYDTDQEFYLCAGCVATDWHLCEDCGDRHTADRLRRTDDDLQPDRYLCRVCLDRYSECDDCERHSRTRSRTAAGSRICRYCAEGYYHGCEGCDELIPIDDDSCAGCHEEDAAPDNEHVHCSDYRPEFVFRGQGPVYLGMELEVGVPWNCFHECVDATCRALGDLAYLKEDGSIDCGFEIVTHPMSYDYAIRHFPWTLLDRLDTTGCFTHSSTGLHVHVSRAGFTGPAHAYRWMKFIYRNQTPVVVLARRQSGQWAEFSPAARTHIGKSAKGATAWHLGRYQAVNTCSDTTFEVRIFRSSLNVRQVQAALAFVAASVAYTGSFHAHDVLHHRAWDWDRFVDWLGHHPEYAPLRDELEALACAC